MSKRWLDFSGAPPLLLPASLVPSWRGGVDPGTGEYRDLDEREPVTDYDRACAAAWPGRGVISVGASCGIALYTEFDEHTWDAEGSIVACGSWLPTLQQLSSADWSDPLQVRLTHGRYVLMNSAADGSSGLREDDHMEVLLSPGEWRIEYASIEADRVGCFHRFSRVA